MVSNKRKLSPTDDIEEQISAEGRAISPEEMQKILHDAEKVDLTATTAEASVIKPEQLIYCGPNLPQGVLNQHSVYIGGLPKHIAAQVETCPAIGRLFVPVDELTHTQRAIQEAGTPEHIWYGQITRYMEGGDSE